MDSFLLIVNQGSNLGQFTTSRAASVTGREIKEALRGQGFKRGDRRAGVFQTDKIVRR